MAPVAPEMERGRLRAHHEAARLGHHVRIGCSGNGLLPGQDGRRRGDTGGRHDGAERHLDSPGGAEPGRFGTAWGIEMPFSPIMPATSVTAAATVLARKKAIAATTDANVMAQPSGFMMRS